MKKAVLFCVCITLSFGCATNKKIIQTKVPSDSYDQLEFSSWRADGRFSLNHKEESFNAKFKWIQRDQLYELRVSGPLGMNPFIIKGNDYGIQAIDGNNKEQLDSFEVITQELPIQFLKYWIMGYPSPESVSENVILSQGYTEFTQFDWNIKINEYQQNKTINFPKRIYINNTKTNVNIIIDKWQLKN